MTFTITESNIRYDVENAIRELEEDGMMEVPNENRADFVDDCVQTIIDKVELYEHSPLIPSIDYRETVLDMADDYGYML